MFCKGLYNKLYDIDMTVRFERVTELSTTQPAFCLAE